MIVEPESGERHVIELPSGSYDYGTDMPTNQLGIVVAPVTATLAVVTGGVGRWLVVVRTRAT